MKFILTAVLASAFVLSAQQAPAPAALAGSKRFHKLDKNGDGRLSLDEFKAVGKNPAHREKRFRRLDANHDGFLSPEEFAAGVRPAPAL